MSLFLNAEGVKGFGALVLLIMLLSACERSVVRRIEQYQPDQSLYQLEQWSMEGRVAVHAANDSFSAALLWRHRQKEDLLALSGPFGQGRTIIKVLPDSVIVDDGEHPQQYFQPAEDVFKRFFAVRFPVRSVAYWLVGLADPVEPISLDRSGFVQAGWRVEYLQEQRVENVFLPKKIRLTHQQTKIKIIIDQWKLN